MRSVGIDEIRQIIADERRSVRVRRVANGSPDWHVADGRLVNRAADFFSVHASLDHAGKRILGLHQCEDVIVAVVVADWDTDPRVLLSVRSEPGLIGLTCLSSTVQSTRSNYLRSHGGHATPHLGLVMGPTMGRVLHSSTQFDWGDVYDGKLKRFLLVEADPPPRADPGFVWVTLETIRRLLGADHLITNDLRASLTALLALRASTSEGTGPGSPNATAIEGCSGRHRQSTLEPVDMEVLRRVNWGRTRFVDDHGNRLEFHRTIARSREVPTWVQPLLHLPKRREVVLHRTDEPAPRYAVRARTQHGTLGRSLLGPSIPIKPVDGRTVRAASSAEGGRFLRHHVDLTLKTVEAEQVGGTAWPEDTSWLSEDEVLNHVLRSSMTQLEIRLAMSLRWADPRT